MLLRHTSIDSVSLNLGLPWDYKIEIIVCNILGKLTLYITAYNKVNKDELMYFSLNLSFSAANLLSSCVRVYVRPLAPKSTVVNSYISNRNGENVWLRDIAERS